MIQDYGFRLYNPAIGKFLSVDPLAPDYPSWTPYAFAMNRPIDGIDLDGLEWKDADGNELSAEQRKDVKVFIFHSEDFKEQAMVEYNAAIEEYGVGSVALSVGSTTDQFKQDWGDMSGKDIQKVVLDFHGKNQSFSLGPDANQQYTSTGDGATNLLGRKVPNVQDLPTPQGNIEYATLELNTCHADDLEPKAHGEGNHRQGDLKGVGQPTLAQAFRSKFDFEFVRATSGSVNYYHWRSYFGGWRSFKSYISGEGIYNTPYPEDGTWKYLHKSESKISR